MNNEMGTGTACQIVWSSGDGIDERDAGLGGWSYQLAFRGSSALRLRGTFIRLVWFGVREVTPGGDAVVATATVLASCLLSLDPYLKVCG